MTAEVVLALGSNLGDRLANLRAAVEALQRRGIEITAASSVWETEPVPPGQPTFLNAVVRGRCALDPRHLLVLAKEIERALGRRPGPRWGPRVIDIDILFYGNERVSEPDLEIPHPRITERPFVLLPLAEVWPGELPVLGAAPAEFLASLDTSGAVKLVEPLLPPAAGAPSTAG
ncbi:Bifunctional folate synthesis protein [bacterium HR29]|nr:Bifunctional folate synthesis protein [bacterium HR29]